MTGRTPPLIVLVFAIAACTQSATAGADAESSNSGDRSDKVLTVHLKVEAKDAKCLLNLDTELIDTPVTDIHPRSEQLQWYKQIGLDLICTTRKTDKATQTVLEGLNLQTAPYKPADTNKPDPFPDISVGRMRELLQGSKASPETPQDAFVFKTDTGRMGALKIKSIDKNGITFQYKLEEDPKERFKRELLADRKPTGAGKPKRPERKLKTVRRFKAFDKMLKKNGFAVTAEQLPQMFSAYIPVYMRRSSALPPFITTDSAWHTYHVILEEGVKRMEQKQAARLKTFSKTLLARAVKLASDGQADFDKVAQYASVALALQDEAHARSIGDKYKDTITVLNSGEGQVRGPVGFPLSAGAFRASSFYTSSPELSRYFTARQWYAKVVFPLEDKDATSLAARLAMLIDSDDELRCLWGELSEPYDSLLAKTKDGDVTSYAAAVSRIVGKDATFAQTAKSTEALQKHLRGVLADPQVNDQLLDDTQYANFPKLIKGFRLLPPRRLTSSVCFQKTAPPGSDFPSGLHFMVACKQMNSPPALRALQQQVGKKKAQQTQQIDPGKLPDSLHGRAMKLISTLQKPVPAKAPRAMQTDAWADKQLWTQLGAWAEQRHTWALHAKLSYTTFGSDGAGDLGMVSPYPDFFESLGKLAKGTSEVLTRADAVNDRNMKLVSADLLKHAETYTWFCEAVEGDLESVDRKRLRDSEEIVERISEFVDECVEDHRSLFGFAKRPTDAQVLKRLTELARRCLKTAKGADGDLKVLNAFVQSEIGVIERLEVLARLCGELSSIARKQLAGKSLNKEENETIRMYGPTLGYLHFYEGNSWDDPEDDSPIISPIFVNPNPRVRRTLYAALGRPHAIYVLAKLSGETRLMKGAVLSYHEFTGPTSQPLDDQAWRRIVREQKSAPPRPDFTKSFIVAPGEDKVIEMLRDGKMYVGIDSIVSRKITNTLIAMLPNIGEEDRYRLLDHLLVRCSEQDAPTLLKLLRDSAREGSKHETDSLQDIVRLVAEAPCKPIASELMKMLVAKNDDYAHAAAYILGRRPELIDAKQLTSGYDKLTTSRRGLYCMLLGALPNIDQAASKTMLKALDETDAYLRWHGAVALANSGANSPAVIKALTRRVDDSNSYVASAALNALKEIDALPNTPDLLKTLKRYCLDHRQDPKAAAELKAIEVPGHKRINSLKPRRYSMVPEPIPLDTAIVGVLTDIECKQAAPVFIDIMISGGFPMKDIGLFELGRLDRENFDKYLTDIALNDKLDFTLRSEAIRYVQFADHPIRACRRLVVLLGDKTKAPPEFPGAKSPAIGDLAIITMGKVLFPKPRDESDTGLFDPYTPVDAKAEKQRLKKVAKKVRQWAKATTQPADK